MALGESSADAESRNYCSSDGAPKGDQYYFINKSGKSTQLSQSSLTEQAAIQSHVQRGRRRPRRRKSVSFEAYAHRGPDERQNSSSVNSTLSTSRIKSVNPCRQAKSFAKSGKENRPPKPRSHQGNSERLNTEDQPSKLPTSKTPNISLFFVDANPKRSRKDHELEDARRRAHAAQEAHRRRRDRSCITSPTSQTKLCKVDPFNAASVEVDHIVVGLLHYYVHFYHPTLWPNEMVVLRHGLYTFQSAVNSIVKTAMENKLAMYCLLSASASRLQFIDRLPCSQVTGKETHYLHNALKLLRSRINASGFQEPEQLKQFLICVIFLTSAEAYRDDVSAARTHLLAAVRLLRPNGGIMSVKDENLRGQLAMGDLYLACVKLEPCLFDCGYDPGPASVLKLTGDELEPLGDDATATSLLDSDVCILPSDLRTLIEQVLESYRVKNRLRTSSMSASRAMQTTHWITTRNMAIRNRLLALATTDSCLHALRVAMIMWTLLAMNVTGRTKTVKVMAPMLRSIIAKTPTDWFSKRDHQLWILVVGFSCATEGTEDSTWFAKRCCSFAFCRQQKHTRPSQTLVDSLAERLEIFQRGFFFDVQVQKPRTRRLAEQLVQLQPTQ